MTDEQLAAIKARADAATPGPLSISRYEHGGGRVFIETDHGRELVADCYDAGNREFYFQALEDVTVLLAEVQAWKDRFTDLAHDKAELLAENERLREALTYIQQRASSMTGTRLGAPMEERRIWEDLGKQATKALGA